MKSTIVTDSAVPGLLEPLGLGDEVAPLLGQLALHLLRHLSRK